MSKDLFEALRDRGLISDEKLSAISDWYDHPQTNLAVELRTLLYLGVLLFTGGLGVLIYSHIDQLGHITIVGALAALLLGALAWSTKVARPFAWQKVESPNPWYDYVLLLAGLLVPILAGYLQSQFGFFGNHWGLATFVPMLVLFAMAYYFDHQGILSLGISTLAAWLGITLQPQLLNGASLLQPPLITTAFMLGILLLVLAALLGKTRFKPHFSTTYQQFGMHIAFLANLAAIMEFPRSWWAWLFALAALVAWHLRKAFAEKNSYYMMTATIYGYIGCCYVVSAKILEWLRGEEELYANLFFYLFSGIGVAMLIHRLHQQIKTA